MGVIRVRASAPMGYARWRASTSWGTLGRSARVESALVMEPAGASRGQGRKGYVIAVRTFCVASRRRSPAGGGGAPGACPSVEGVRPADTLGGHPPPPGRRPPSLHRAVLSPQEEKPRHAMAWQTAGRPLSACPALSLPPYRPRPSSAPVTAARHATDPPEPDTPGAPTAGGLSGVEKTRGRYWPYASRGGRGGRGEG